MIELLKELTKIFESQENLIKFLKEKELFKKFVLELLQYDY